MTLLGATGVDEVQERKATISLEGNQLGLLKIENPQVGQCIQVCAELCIQSISAYPDEKGVPHPCISFQVESIAQEEEENDGMDVISSMYPAMK